MIRAPRWCAWVLLLAGWAGSLRAAERPVPPAASHCAPSARILAASHKTHAAATSGPAAGNPSGVGGGHDCPGCQSGHCPGIAHCLTAGSLAAAPHAPAFSLAGPCTSDRSSPDDRPLSANPTPPIPPPQLAL